LRGQLPTLKTFELFAQAEFTQAIEQLTDNQANQTQGAGLADVDAEKIASVLQQLQAYLVAEDYESLRYFAESREVLMHLPEATFQRLESAIQELDFEKAINACQAT
jgi:hypothetical protein